MVESTNALTADYEPKRWPNSSSQISWTGWPFVDSNYFIYQSPPLWHMSQCPECGYCPHCGRSNKKKEKKHG